MRPFVMQMDVWELPRPSAASESIKLVCYNFRTQQEGGEAMGIKEQWAEMRKSVQELRDSDAHKKEEASQPSGGSVASDR